MKPTLGLVVALSVEGRFLLGRGGWRRCEGWPIRRMRVAEDTELICIRSGVGIENAYAAARYLIKEGVSTLVAAGLAGGLHPGLKVGDVIVPAAVGEETEKGAVVYWRTDSGLVQWGRNILIKKGFGVDQGVLISARRPCLTVERKGDLFRRSRAHAVDMESAGVARAAGEADMRFYVLRTVSDTADLPLPDTLPAFLNENGSVDWAAAVVRIIRDPHLLGEMVRLRRGFLAALVSLRLCWHAHKHQWRYAPVFSADKDLNL